VTLPFPARRLIIAGGFAVAVAAAPALTIVGMPAVGPPAAPVAQQCPGGEEDIFTGICVPHTVPNAGAPFQTIPGNPDIPAIMGVPCTGHNSGQCIGLAEEAQAQGPQPVPESTVSSSP
jgi:hypothetical protein